MVDVVEVIKGTIEVGGEISEDLSGMGGSERLSRGGGGRGGGKCIGGDGGAVHR